MNTRGRKSYLAWADAPIGWQACRAAARRNSTVKRGRPVWDFCVASALYGMTVPVRFWRSRLPFVIRAIFVLPIWLAAVTVFTIPFNLVIIAVCAPVILLLGVLGAAWGLVAGSLGGVVKVVEIGHKAHTIAEGAFKGPAEKTEPKR